MASAKAAMRQAGIADPPVYGDNGEEEQTENTYSSGTDSSRDGDQNTAPSASYVTPLDLQKSPPSTTYEPTSCPCGLTKTEKGLTCGDCKKRIHVSCSQLPLYQVCIYLKTSRKYTCLACATPLIDDSTREEIEAAITATRTGSVQAENQRPVTDYTLPAIQHKETTGLLRNMEEALGRLASQVADLTTAHEVSKAAMTRVGNNVASTTPPTRASPPAPTRGHTKVTPASPLSQDGLSDHNDSSSSSSESGDESDREEEENDKDDNPAPRVLILHDSILRALDPERLGDSYGLQVEKQKASTVEDCASKSGGQTPEAIVIHTGINNLKTETAEKASEKFVSVVQELASKHPDAKIVVSKLVPTHRQDLQAKRELYNAMVFSALHQKERVSFINHDTLGSKPAKAYYDDDIHPSKRGAGIMAGSIGRHLSQLLWEKPAAHVKNKSRRHYRHQHPQHETDYKERQSQKTPNWPKRDNNRDNHHHGEGSNYIRQGQQHRRTRYQPRRPYRNHHAGLNQQDDHNRGNDYHRHHDPRQDRRRGRQYYTAYHQDHWDHRERRSSNTWQDDRWNDWHSYRDSRHGGQSKYW
ncbi:hypothetical protein BaRGS_00006690 [Batillaria attramentaria]|uniref:Zinc finger PHD-type domain-containing protein n=1 Tax=Batillaria attramentaria TaxID=370345 RepID=A0ABD0LR16_9CAEN